MTDLSCVCCCCLRPALLLFVLLVLLVLGSSLRFGTVAPSFLRPWPPAPAHAPFVLRRRWPQQQKTGLHWVAGQLMPLAVAPLMLCCAVCEWLNCTSMTGEGGGMGVYVLVRLTVRGGSTFFPPSCCAACQHSVAMATIPGSQVCSKGSRVAKRKLNGTFSERVPCLTFHCGRTLFLKVPPCRDTVVVGC